MAGPRLDFTCATLQSLLRRTNEMRHLALPIWLTVLCNLAPLGAGEKTLPKKAPLPPRNLDGQTIVFVIDGAGDSTIVAENLREAALETKTPLCMTAVHWCRHGVPADDYADHQAQLAAAARVAGEIARLTRESPKCRIVLLAHSSGTRVALAAAEACPPQSISRIILLASTVSCGYDLGPALRASRGGIDSFYSQWDTVLSIAEDALGTADGMHDTPSAGRVGFRLRHAKANVRQYAWRDGNPGAGDHYAWTWPSFLGSAVIPMIHSEIVAVGK